MRQKFSRLRHLLTSGDVDCLLGFVQCCYGFNPFIPSFVYVAGIAMLIIGLIACRACGGELREVDVNQLPITTEASTTFADDCLLSDWFKFLVGSQPSS